MKDLFALIGFFVFLGWLLNESTPYTREEVEKAYMEGQRDALTGDVRIQKLGTHWAYTKSPWDGQTDIPPVRIEVKKEEEF